jgi:hypothetical protein
VVQESAESDCILVDVRKESECIVMMKKDADEQDESFEIELGERWSPCTLFVAFGKGLR